MKYVIKRKVLNARICGFMHGVIGFDPILDYSKLHFLSNKPYLGRIKSIKYVTDEIYHLRKSFKH